MVKQEHQRSRNGRAAKKKFRLPIILPNNKTHTKIIATRQECVRAWGVTWRHRTIRIRSSNVQHASGHSQQVRITYGPQEDEQAAVGLRSSSDNEEITLFDFSCLHENPYHHTISVYVEVPAYSLLIVIIVIYVRHMSYVRHIILLLQGEISSIRNQTKSVPVRRRRFVRIRSAATSRNNHWMSIMRQDSRSGRGRSRWRTKWPGQPKRPQERIENDSIKQRNRKGHKKWIENASIRSSSATENATKSATRSWCITSASNKSEDYAPSSRKM